MARPKKYEVRTVEDITYMRWCAMRTRVNSQDRHRHAVICEDWESFIKFKADMGECPEGYSLERINNDLGYNKQNCKWIPINHQSKNRRCNILYKGRPLKDVCERVGAEYKTVWYRVQRMGMSVEDALNYRSNLMIKEKLKDLDACTNI